MSGKTTCGIAIEWDISDKKKNELLGHKTIWERLKCILLSESSLLKKNYAWIIPTTWHYGESKTGESKMIIAY